MFVPARNRDAFDPREPFSRAEARAAGLTAEMLLSKRFHKIFWDAYVSSDVPITSLLRAKAVIRLVPTGSYISNSTAAELWGCRSTARRCHAHHLAVGLWSSGTAGSSIALSLAAGANHAS